MGLVQNLQLLILKLVWLLGWLSSFVFAQFELSEGVSGSLSNLPTLGITCVANLAFLVASVIRGRLDLEIGARDVLDILVSPKLKKIDGIRHGHGLITYTGQESQQVVSTRVGIQKMKNIFIQKMKNIFNWLRHRLHSVPCVTEEEGLQTASTEEGDPQTASTEDATAYLEEVRVRSREQIPVESVAVVMLSNNTPNLSIREFMKSNASIAGSILLQFFLLQGAIENFGSEEVPISPCQCNLQCNCVVFWPVEEITGMLGKSMVGTLKRFPNSLCLIRCLTCFTNHCHPGGEVQQAEEGHSESTVVSEILDDIGDIKTKEHICICIPILHSHKPDVWTELLVRSLRSKDNEARGVRVMAAEALEGYLSRRMGDSSNNLETVEYNIVSFIVPRLTEILINLILTFWFTVDGFSSSLVARRTIRDYLVDSKGSGFAANAFLTKAAVKCNLNSTNVCQVLTFRGDFLGIKTLSVIVGCVNLFSSLGWAVLIGFEHYTNDQKLSKGRFEHYTNDQMLSKGRFGAMIAAIGIALCTDAAIVSIHRFLLYCGLVIPITLVSWFGLVIPITLVSFLVITYVTLLITVAIGIVVILWPWLSWTKKLFFSLILFEIMCVIEGTLFSFTYVDSRTWRYYNLSIRKWVYGAVQILVWMKWAGGSYILSKKNSSEFFGISPHGWGNLVYSSAFFLNAVLAGVRCNWGRWPWTYLINPKLSPQASPQAS